MNRHVDISLPFLSADMSSRARTLSLEFASSGMQDKLPARAIKNVYPGENHDHSYTCIVTLYPPQQTRTSPIWLPSRKRLEAMPTMPSFTKSMVRPK